VKVADSRSESATNQVADSLRESAAGGGVVLMRVRVLPWLLLLVLAGCMEGQKPTPQQKKSLYERLGGEPAIARVVDDFVAEVVADPKIKDRHKKHFMADDVGVLKKKLIDQIGEATGGPQKYTGKNMKDAHKGLEITNADFDALVGCLERALDRNKVGKAEKDELLGKLAGLRKDVVEKAE
jgi:hemoglobin